MAFQTFYRLSLISQSLISQSLISQSMIYRLFGMCHSGACASIFRFSEIYLFFGTFHLPRSGPCAHVSPAPPVRMREYFSTFRKNFLFRNFSIFRGLGLARTSPGRRQCACASIFRLFGKKFFSKLFHLPRSGTCAHVPQAPPVRMREYFSTFRKFIFFFGTFPSSSVRALRARPPGAASAHARVFFDFSEFFFFFRTFPSSAVRALRARPPGAASAHARVFFDFSINLFFFRNFSIFRGLGPARTSPRRRQCACASIFSEFFFSELFHLPRSGPCAHVPPAPPVRMREYFSTFRK